MESLAVVRPMWRLLLESLVPTGMVMYLRILVDIRTHFRNTVLLHFLVADVTSVWNRFYDSANSNDVFCPNLLKE